MPQQIKFLSSRGQTIVVDYVDQSALQLRHLACSLFKCRADDIRLIFQGKEIKDKPNVLVSTLGVGVSDSSVVHVFLKKPPPSVVDLTEEASAPSRGNVVDLTFEDTVL